MWQIELTTSYEPLEVEDANLANKPMMPYVKLIHHF